MQFEWDLKKARANNKRHGVSFEEASKILKGNYTCIEDTRFDEQRFAAIGRLKDVLVVIYCYRSFDTIRIISARKATAYERKTYEEGI